MSGWIIVYWPGTRCAMYVGDADEKTPAPEGGVFLSKSDGPPPAVEDRPKSRNDIENEKRSELTTLMQDAENQKSAFSVRIGVLNDAVKYAMATQDEIAELELRTAQLENWGKYAVLLSRVSSQSDLYSSSIWPVQPSERL